MLVLTSSILLMHCSVARVLLLKFHWVMVIMTRLTDVMLVIWAPQPCTVFQIPLLLQSIEVPRK